ncbi:MAG: CAP domain-containing protein [Legionella sp.]|uniref:CAP domain-containing protein n=1 Tax=Legionella sp. TaxID=459 RepID=UPI00284926A7|nr:CAP domain-containing protein [Legionella sp.]
MKRNLKKSIAILGILLIALILWQSRFWLQKNLRRLPQISENPIIATIKQNISAPPPLVGNLLGQNSLLTDAGVILETNQNRAENGNLPALTENFTLDGEAEAKLKDMFKNQYFEHVSPSGRGPADLAKAAGYGYISIGENLAMGNFKDDKELVTAWMNSPGHRANILDKNFTEIGVAVGQGRFQGKQVWLAVQEFGRPLSSCPGVDANLKIQVADLQTQANQLQSQIEHLKTQMDAASLQSQADYNAYNSQVASYNNLVEIYNNKVDVLKLAAARYNAQVNAYNACAGQ